MAAAAAASATAAAAAALLLLPDYTRNETFFEVTLTQQCFLQDH